MVWFASQVILLNFASASVVQLWSLLFEAQNASYAGHGNGEDAAEAQTAQADHDPGGSDGPEGEQVAELVAVFIWEEVLVVLDSRVDGVDPVVTQKKRNRSSNVKLFKFDFFCLFPRLTNQEPDEDKDAEQADDTSQASSLLWWLFGAS